MLEARPALDPDRRGTWSRPCSWCLRRDAPAGSSSTIAPWSSAARLSDERYVERSWTPPCLEQERPGVPQRHRPRPTSFASSATKAFSGPPCRRRPRCTRVARRRRLVHPPPTLHLVFGLVSRPQPPQTAIIAGTGTLSRTTDGGADLACRRHAQRCERLVPGDIGFTTRRHRDSPCSPISRCFHDVRQPARRSRTQ